MQDPDTRVCWICQQNPADSREHKFKASDLRRAFGRGPWVGDSRPVHGVANEQLRDVQGPRQESMTFGAVICEACNTATSQPWDRAYDAFFDWVLRNRAAVGRHRTLDFAAIYKEGWEKAQLNLFRYFTKHLGCNIARTEAPVPDDLREVLHRAPFRTALRVTFHVQEDLLAAPGLDDGLFLGGLAYYEPADVGIPGFYSHVIVGWMMVCFWYGLEVTDQAATPWIANTKTLTVGAHSVLTDAQREELRRRARGLPHRPVSGGEDAGP